MSEQTEKKISIIIPCYNVDKYIDRCINSLVAQTLGIDALQLILVDDASPDNCGKMCDEYAACHANVKVIHKENGGLSSARNAGLDIAQGEYIVFIDSDDFIRECYLEDLVKLAQQYHADLVACHFRKSEKFSGWEDKDEIVVYRGEEVIDHRYVNDVVMTVAWNKLYHRKFFEEYGLRYPNGKIHEDNFLTPQILYWAKCMVITGKSLYFYRVREDSIVTGAFSEKRLDKLESMEYYLDFYQRIAKQDLYYRELDGYFRNLMSFYVLMSKADKKRYDAKIQEVRQKLYQQFCSHFMDGRLKLKLRLKVMLFLLKNRWHGGK